MADRASIFEGVQIGVETTPGTAVAANKKLQSMSIRPGVRTEITKFRPSGVKFHTLTAQNKEWVEAAIEGQPTYTEIIYPLSSIMAGSVDSGDGGTPVAYTWTFGIAANGADTTKTFTIEQGSSLRAHKFTYGLVTALNFEFNRSELRMAGSMVGQRLTDNITMTASPTSLALVPILPNHVTVYLDNNAAGLGTTDLERVLSASLEISDRFGQLWTLNAANESWAAHIETAPTVKVKLKVEADATGMALLETMRTGDSKFMRIDAVGNAINAETDYQFKLDLALKVTNVSDFADEDGIFAIEWEFDVVYDATWGKALELVVVNGLGSL